MLGVRLSKAMEERLVALAGELHCSKSDIIREAISEHLDDLEDYLSAVEALKDIESGKSEVISAEEAWQELGV